MKVAIVGGGMTGLSAAEALAEQGAQCTVFEREATLGGLAGSFMVGGTYLEKFYHHLFTSDTAMTQLIERVGLGAKLQWLPTSNSYYVNKIYRLSTPLDLLRFSHISLLDRIRLGLLYLRTNRVRDWKPLEDITAKKWLIGMAGEAVYESVWHPLLRTKFGQYADQVAAVWIWNKLKLRGSSRGSQQEERLGYVQGGFGQVVDALEQRLLELGVCLRQGTAVEEIRIQDGRATGVRVAGAVELFDQVIVTTAPELFAAMAPALPPDYAAKLRSIQYLANVCLVIELDRSLSSTYWLNIGDPTIPFTGVIEHTNMQRPEDYGGAHLVYISRYLDAGDPLYRLATDDIVTSYVPYLQRMFAGFERAWIQRAWAWRERYTQPVIGLHYSQRKPDLATPVDRLWLSCMAQVYPEDRGMNYAVVYGQKVARELLVKSAF
jgi:protoporphyrinogen oxidase